VLLADHVVVIGGRPARIVGDVTVPAERPRPRRITLRPDLIAAAESVRALLPM
jgi:ABC-type nitrate/sulfonate/bicarbonate transport system ATPase subunit